MSGDDEHVSECSHAEVIRREPGGRWLCRYCQEPFVQSFKLDGLQKEHDALIHDHERAMTRECDQLAEALERDRKGDQIIHELTIERDRFAGRLDAIREIVEPTGAYLFSGHVNALAEIRAIIVEGQWPNCGCQHLQVCPHQHVHRYDDDGQCECGDHALGVGQSVEGHDPNRPNEGDEFSCCPYHREGGKEPGCGFVASIGPDGPVRE